MRNVKCALCDSDNNALLLSSIDKRYHSTTTIYQLVRCRNCGLIYLNPMPQKDEIAQFYPGNMFSGESFVSKEFSKVIYRSKFYKLTKSLPAGKVLDIGCGGGNILSLFERKKWQAYGVEISEDGYQNAKKKSNLSIFNCELKNCRFPADFFDYVILNHVLEHLLFPIEEPKEIFRIMKPQGLLYVSVPNIDSFQFRCTRENWFHLDLPRHAYHYSPKTICELLQKKGFSIVSITFPVLDFPMDFVQSLRFLSNNKISKFIKTLFLIPLSLVLISAKLIPSCRGTMEVIAQKTCP